MTRWSETRLMHLPVSTSRLPIKEEGNKPTQAAVEAQVHPQGYRCGWGVCRALAPSFVLRPLDMKGHLPPQGPLWRLDFQTQLGPGLYAASKHLRGLRLPRRGAPTAPSIMHMSRVPLELPPRTAPASSPRGGTPSLRLPKASPRCAEEHEVQKGLHLGSNLRRKFPAALWGLQTQHPL